MSAETIKPEMDWNKIVGQVESINRWLRPLKYLEDIPNTVNAALLAVKEANEELAKREEELTRLKKEIVRDQKKLNDISQQYADAWAAKLAELNGEADKVRAEFEKEFATLEKSKNDAISAYEGMLKDHRAFMDKNEQKREGLLQEIAKAEAQLKEYQETIKKVLGK